MTKKHTLIFTLVGIVVLAIGAYLLQFWLHQPVLGEISKDVSSQSKARTEQMKAEGKITSPLKSVSNEAGEVFTTKCFKTIIPLPFSTIKKSEEGTNCSLRAQLSSPRGLYVVHSEYKPNLLSLAEASGVMLRKQSSEYTNIELETTKLNTLAYKSASELTVFIYEPPILISIAFSELGAVDDSTIQAAENALSNFELLAVEQAE